MHLGLPVDAVAQPPLRENWAIPVLYLQHLQASRVFRLQQRQQQQQRMQQQQQQRTQRRGQLALQLARSHVLLAAHTALLLSLWQLSHFLVAIQILALSGTGIDRSVSRQADKKAGRILGRQARVCVWVLNMLTSARACVCTVHVQTMLTSARACVCTVHMQTMLTSSCVCVCIIIRLYIRWHHHASIHAFVYATNDVVPLPPCAPFL